MTRYAILSTDPLPEVTMSPKGFLASSLSFQLGVGFLVLVTVAVLNALTVHHLLNEQAGIADTIGVAGRLRMLSQKLAAETFLTMNAPLGRGGKVDIYLIEFESGLDGVERGGQAYGYLVKRPPGALDDKFNAVRRHWQTYRDDLARVLRDSPQTDTSVAMNQVMGQAQRLLDSLESLIATINTAVREREQQARSILNGLFLADILCLLFAFVFIRRRIIKPVQHFAEVSHRFGAGDHQQRIAHSGGGEMGQFATAFNRMADQLVQDIARFSEEAKAQRALWLHTKKLSEAVEHSPVSVIITDHQGIIEYVNPRFTEISGYSAAEVIGRTPSLFKSGETPADVYRQLWQTIRNGQTWTGDLLNRKRTGELYWEATRIAPLRDEHGEIVHFVSVKSDITARKEADKALRLRQRAVEASSNGIVMIEADAGQPTVLYVNPAFTRITGFAEDNVAGKPAYGILGFDDEVGLQTQALDPLQHAEGHTWVAQAMRKDGGTFWCEYALAAVKDMEGLVTHYVAALSDVTERIDYEQRLAYQATHDALTGLANRTLLADRIGQAISQANRYGQAMAVVLIDLDHFKNVNDTLGHSVGDRLLQVAAGRLTDCVREIDTVARMGGDEFVIVLTGFADTHETEVALQRIVDTIAAPYILEGNEAHISCSAGASFYPKDGQCADELVRHADTAMYQAKSLGRNNFQFYQPAMNERLSHRVSMETQLRHALEREELFLHYQPQIDLQRRVIVGVEALVRWQHPELGIVSPGQFIPMAEESGLIVPIGTWVLAAACAQAQAWSGAGLPAVRMAVNLSVRQLKQKKLGALIDDVLKSTGLDPARLELEITESVIVDDPDGVIRLLLKLKEHGLRIALDDFGTGYSSLNYLKRLPIDVLKIDQSFVRGIDTDRNDAALTRTVIGLANCLDLETIAEGVEVATQVALLEAWGCKEAQGFLFHRPMAANDITHLLRSGMDSNQMDGREAQLWND